MDLLPPQMMEGLGAIGCFASIVSLECWLVCYKSSWQLQESSDCGAAVAEQREMLCPEEFPPWGWLYPGVCVCVCTYMKKYKQYTHQHIWVMTDGVKGDNNYA